MANFLQNELFLEVIAPFLLIFTIVFAILDKSKLLGDDKKQINAIIALLVGGIFVGVGQYVDWIKDFTIFLTIALIILFIFMLVYSFAYGDTKGNPLSDNYKKIIAGIAFVAVVIAALVITDTWSNVNDWFTDDARSGNIILVIVVAVAVGAVLFLGKKKE